jgi:hypothetical protein
VSPQNEREKGSAEVAWSPPLSSTTSFLALLGFELQVSHLLGRHSTT